MSIEPILIFFALVILGAGFVLGFALASCMGSVGRMDAYCEGLRDAGQDEDVRIPHDARTAANNTLRRDAGRRERA